MNVSVMSIGSGMPWQTSSMCSASNVPAVEPAQRLLCTVSMHYVSTPERDVGTVLILVVIVLSKNVPQQKHIDHARLKQSEMLCHASHQPELP